MSFFFGVLGGAEGLPPASRVCRGPPLTFTGEDGRESFESAGAISLEIIFVAFPLAAVLTCGSGGEGVGDREELRDEQDDSTSLGDVDVGDGGRHCFARNRFAEANFLTLLLTAAISALVKVNGEFAESVSDNRLSRLGDSLASAETSTREVATDGGLFGFFAGDDLAGVIFAVFGCV